MIKSRSDYFKITDIENIGLTGSNALPSFAVKTPNQKMNQVTLNHATTILSDGNAISIPFWRIDSGIKGPALAIVAAQHGNEVQGAEIARRFKEICAKQLIAGSVWMVPLANPLAIRIRRHSINLGPEQPISFARAEGHNMNSLWPGNNMGNDTERLVYTIDQSVISHCSHVVDIHCWNLYTAASTLVFKDHEPSRILAKSTTTRFIDYSNLTAIKDGKMNLRRLMPERGGSSVTIELSGQFQIQERQVMIGLNSIMNIARQLNMIEGDLEKIGGTRAIKSNGNSHEIKAPCPGIFMPALNKRGNATLIPDDYVDEGQLLGHIIRESDLETIKLHAPTAGYLSRLGTCHANCDVSLHAQHPYVVKDDLLAIVTSVIG